MHRRLIALAAAGLVISGCGAAPIPAENQQPYLNSVRKHVPSAAFFSDDQLLDMAETICTHGDVDRGVDALDNYSLLDAEDREPLASLAVSVAC